MILVDVLLEINSQRMDLLKAKHREEVRGDGRVACSSTCIKLKGR